MIPNIALSLMRIIQFTIGASLGIFAIFWTAPEMKRLNASVGHGEQILGAVIFTLAYLGISALAVRDVRASSLFAGEVALLSTPLYVLLWLFSQWDTRSSHQAIPWLWGIGANIVLFASGIVGFVLSSRDQLIAVAPPVRKDER